MVKVKDLCLSYSLPHKKNIAALDHLNAEFEEGKISVIVGPSGCGKTSLIKIIAGLLVPDKGEVLVNQVPVQGVRKNTAVIFQDYGLLPWKTVRANALLPLRLGSSGSSVKNSVLKHGIAEVDRLLLEFGLEDFKNYYPRRLSGGMKQRLAIVRALVMKPELLLMDEPFSSLDAFTREEAQDYFLTVRNNFHATIIMVSHSIEEAVYLGDRVFVMIGKNPGTIGQYIAISRGNNTNSQFRANPGFQEYCINLRGILGTGR